MEKAIRRAKKEGKIAKTAQQTIPYEEMYPDGICRITNRLYSKSVLCDDINYAEASDDEKAVLFELYCKLVNYFGPSVGFELSVICYPADLVEYRKMLALNPQGDQFDEIRKEYSDILVAAVIHLIDRRKSENYLLIELPEYKIPSSRTVAIYVWEKVKDYLTKAGTTIFVASILMWVILNFGPQGYTTEMADSFGAILGHWLVPFFAPIGLGFWQIAVALIAGISAKEVVVSSCAVLFGVPNINSGAGMDTLVGILSASGFGQLNAFCLMVFCLLYIPCAAALATIRKESGSTRWMLLSALFQLVVAWVVTFIVYRIGLFI